MRGGVGLAVAPGGPVAPEELGIGAFALDGGDIVVLDGQRHRGLQVALEGQVDIAGIEHQPALDGTGSGEGDDDPARPVGDRPRPVAIAPDPGARRALQRDGEVGAGVGGHAHLLRRPDPFVRRLDALGERGVGQQPFQSVRVFVGDHQEARAVGDDVRQFRRMEHSLHRHIDDEGAGGERPDRRPQPLQGGRRAGGAHRHGSGLRRRDDRDMERPRAAPEQRKLGQLHIEPPRLGFRKDRDFLALPHLAEAEDGVERRDPAFLYAVGEHVRSLLPVASAARNPFCDSPGAARPAFVAPPARSWSSAEGAGLRPVENAAPPSCLPPFRRPGEVSWDVMFGIYIE